MSKFVQIEIFIYFMSAVFVQLFNQTLVYFFCLLIENSPFYWSIYLFRKNISGWYVRKMIKTELALRTHSTKLKCPSETLSNMISLDIKWSYDIRLCHKSMKRPLRLVSLLCMRVF